MYESIAGMSDAGFRRGDEIEGRTDGAFGTPSEGAPGFFVSGQFLLRRFPGKGRTLSPSAQGCWIFLVLSVAVNHSTAPHNKVAEIPPVIPACSPPKACGDKLWRESRRKAWMPAFAGMTVGYRTPIYVELY